MIEEMLAFWRARLEEDEQAARAAAGDSAADWFADAQEGWDADERSVKYTGPSTLRPGGIWDYPVCRDLEVSGAVHIARHDPARVLRDVAADRELLARYERATRGDLPEWKAGRELIEAGVAVLLAAIRLRVAVCRDHPGYRAEWAA